MIGETISHYKILEKLGEGGMGVVYKAQDTQLNRTVALKFLPDRVNKDATAKARFLQEAQAAAGLNHPNICTIFGVEEHEGSLFMSMEYVEGGTLREKIPFAKADDAVSIAVEIGDALHEAHDKGIVHRDIKADNIMLTSKGQAKVMDFGLAKLKGAMKLTRTSSTVGTLGYMAPEQIQGGEVDHRSDIFSFGVLLFEMLTGKLPFRGEHEAAMVYSIVNEDPQDIAQLVPNLSPLVANLIQRCLEKDPEDRYQTMQDAVSELRRSQKKTSRISRQMSVERPAMQPSQPMEQPVSSADQMTTTSFFSQRKNIYIVGGAAVLVIAVAAYFLFGSSEPKLNPDMTFRTIQMPFTVFQYPGLSSDGNWIVFPAADANGRWDLYWMHNAGGDARRVTFDSSVTPRFRWLGADISPDGSQIAYDMQNPSGGLPDVYVVSSNGGTGRRIAQEGMGVRWRFDGKRIGYIGSPDRNLSGVYSVKPDGSDPRAEFIDSSTAQGNISFSWSPDGNSIAWIRSFPNNTSEIITVDLHTRQEKQITHDGKNLDEVFWTKNNMIIFSSSKSGNTNLWAVPAEGGEEIQITKGAGPDLGVKVSVDCKRLLYYQNQDIGNIWSANGQGTNLRQLTSDDQNITNIAFSPDKKTIVFAMTSEQGFVSTQSHLYMMDRDGNNRRQLTFGNEVSNRPIFSPDGKHIAYRSRDPQEPADSFKINVIDFPAASSPRILVHGFDAWWINDSEVRIWYKFVSSDVTLNGVVKQQLLQDSLVAFPSSDNSYTGYADVRSKTRGFWVKNNKTGKVRQIAPSASYYNVLPGGRNMYVMGKNRTVWKYHLPDGKKEKLVGNFPGVTSTSLMGFSNDGEDIVFVNQQSRGRLVMIDNLFK